MRTDSTSDLAMLSAVHQSAAVSRVGESYDVRMDINGAFNQLSQKLVDSGASANVDQ